jgi:hypothetical protein
MVSMQLTLGTVSRPSLESVKIATLVLSSIASNQGGCNETSRIRANHLEIAAR